MGQLLQLVKPYLRWFIWGGVLFFLIQTIKNRLAEITLAQLNGRSWILLAIALGITTLAHLWSGWMWTIILKLFNQPLGGKAGVRVYLLTNLAKYSPGNIWHFYGRINAVKSRGGHTGAAVFSVLLEPLLMAAAALLIALVSGSQDQDNLLRQWGGVWFPLTSLILIFWGIRPAVLNPLLQRLSQGKLKKPELEQTTSLQSPKQLKLKHYPLVPFLGELVFVLLRGVGFSLTFMALQPITWTQIAPLFSAFSFAWLLGLVVPGAPGGLGVFEVTAFGMLADAQFPAEITAVALYRLISILAEVVAALIFYPQQAIAKS